MMTPAPNLQFAYAFAKDQGIGADSRRDSLTVAVRHGADPMSLIEARRALGRTFALGPLSREAYERLFADVFSPRSDRAFGS